jgi:hypothetical protein
LFVFEVVEVGINVLEIEEDVGAVDFVTHCFDIFDNLELVAGIDNA